jgi:hypothetical protein
MASGVEQASGSVEANQENPSMLCLRLFDGVTDYFDSYRMHHAVDTYGNNILCNNIYCTQPGRGGLSRSRESERGYHKN